MAPSCVYINSDFISSFSFCSSGSFASWFLYPPIHVGFFRASTLFSPAAGLHQFGVNSVVCEGMKLLIFFVFFLCFPLFVFVGACFPWNLLTLLTLAHYIFLGAIFRSELFCSFQPFVLVVMIFALNEVPNRELRPMGPWFRVRLGRVLPRSVMLVGEHSMKGISPLCW